MPDPEGAADQREATIEDRTPSVRRSDGGSGDAWDLGLDIADDPNLGATRQTIALVQVQRARLAEAPRCQDCGAIGSDVPCPDCGCGPADRLDQDEHQADQVEDVAQEPDDLPSVVDALGSHPCDQCPALLYTAADRAHHVQAVHGSAA